MKHPVEPRCILVNSGMHILPTQLRASDIVTADIVHALSLVNRFNGHTPGPYSVAQHSCHVADYVKREAPDRADLYLAALLHDASEAYLGDVARPIKQQMPTGSYRVWENVAMLAVAEAFKMPVELFDHPLIHTADTAALHWEWESMFGPETVPEFAAAVEHGFQERFLMWSWRDARYQFGQRLASTLALLNP